MLYEYPIIFFYLSTCHCQLVPSIYNHLILTPMESNAHHAKSLVGAIYVYGAHTCPHLPTCLLSPPISVLLISIIISI